MEVTDAVRVVLTEARTPGHIYPHRRRACPACKWSAERDRLLATPAPASVTGEGLPGLDVERLARALRPWRRIFVDPANPDEWYIESARVIAAEYDRQGSR